MNANPQRPQNIDDIMFQVFGPKNKKKKLLPHEQAAKEISKILEERGL
jgi:hypothetical protein